MPRTARPAAEQLLAWRAAGWSYARIAKEAGVSDESIRRWCHEAGAQPAMQPAAAPGGVDGVQPEPAPAAAVQAPEAGPGDQASDPAGQPATEGQEAAGPLTLETLPVAAVAPTLIRRAVNLPASLLAIYDAHRALGFEGSLDAWVTEAVAGYLDDRGHQLAYLLGAEGTAVALAVAGQRPDAPAPMPADEAEADPELQATYRRLVDEGFEGTFREALLEMARAGQDLVAMEEAAS